ncbi:MAG: hypothetical protein JO036_15060 [Candidatus Eremiobacteraeota bacterium]|nr:hypothetical protein [Candidatus Eremiobacteraeota bacterium]
MAQERKGKQRRQCGTNAEAHEKISQQQNSCGPEYCGSAHDAAPANKTGATFVRTTLGGTLHPMFAPRQVGVMNRFAQMQLHCPKDVVALGGTFGITIARTPA